MLSLSVSISLFPNNLVGLQAGLADNATSLSKLLSPISVMSNINPAIMKCSIFLLKISQQRTCINKFKDQYIILTIKLISTGIACALEGMLTILELGGNG